jgi:hypothetical protein
MRDGIERRETIDMSDLLNVFRNTHARETTAEYQSSSPVRGNGAGPWVYCRSIYGSNLVAGCYCHVKSRLYTISYLDRHLSMLYSAIVIAA